MSVPDYGSAFRLWREASPEVWREYTHHDFVEGLRDGTLPYDSFLFYLRQDFVYLIHYARAWALAVAKADSLEEMAGASRTVNALVNHEMALHVGTCAKAGITTADLEATLEAPENLAYTRYVLEAGYSGDFLELLAALASCAFGYGEIGLRLAESATEDNPYREWIETYAGPEYQQSCIEAGKLIDNALIRRLGPDYTSLPCWEKLTDRFVTASRLEGGFWTMGMRGK